MLTFMYVGRTQCRELPLCAGSGEGCQWQALPSPVQCEETATRTQDLPVTGGKTLPLAPGLRCAYKEKKKIQTRYFDLDIRNGKN